MEERLGESWRKRMRKRLFRKQKCCRWCGAKFDEPDRFEGSMPVWATGQRFPTIDHITPLAQGGGNSRGNLTLSCEPCNHTRGSRGPGEGPAIPEPVPSCSERVSRLFAAI
jgi:5-methylcytosine-specific restriction endonuclease McrA